jgi:chemotaxis protein CheX
MDSRTPSTAQPVAPEVRDGLLEPFVAAACLTLREWAGTEAAPAAVYRDVQPRTLGDVSALLRLRFANETQGTLVLGFPARTAETLAARVLAGAAEEVGPDLVHDCMGEAANVLAGQAKALLHETPYRFTFSTPAILSGPGREIEGPAGTDCLVVVFGSDAGNFALQLCLKL